jgi:hypothetical protein
MNRKSFLARVGALIAAPFVVKAKAETPVDRKTRMLQQFNEAQGIGRRHVEQSRISERHYLARHPRKMQFVFTSHISEPPRDTHTMRITSPVVDDVGCHAFDGIAYVDMVTSENNGHTRRTIIEATVYPIIE